MGERQSWSDAPHEQLVGIFRGLIWKERQTRGKDGWLQPPAAIIANALAGEATRYYPLEEQRREYFDQLTHAWDVISYEHYQDYRSGKPSNPQFQVGHLLSGYYRHAKARNEPRPEIITLDPLQVKILDALAEAANIPHQRGQTEIEIPEPFRSDAWYAQLQKPRQR